MTWQYALTSEPDQDRVAITRRLLASSPVHEKGLLRLEESSAGVMRSTLTLKAEHDAVLAIAQGGSDGKTSALNPPVTILPAKLQAGSSWNFVGSVAGVAVKLPLAITGEEAVAVPAGKFRAWHVRGEQTGTVASTVDEWFVRGIGFIKERVAQRSPTGQLLGRHTLELTARPAAVAVSAAAHERNSFEATLSTSASGTAVDTISADALQIVARWRLHRAAGNSRIRAVWIAEDTGSIASSDYQIDEANAIAAAPEAVGSFTLSRPPDGWAAGKYRVDFYLQNNLAASLRVTIVARAAPAPTP